MKPGPIMKVMIVLVTIMAFSVFTFSFLGKKRKKQEEEYGQLEITSTVKETTVFIEGFNIGAPPLELENVYPGIYRVIVKAPGYNDFIKNVEVEKQQVSKVEARMAAGGKRTKIPFCNYSFWDSLTKKERRKLKQARYSSLLMGYKNIEVANFDVKIKSKKPVPPGLLLPFYSDMIKQLDKYTDFPQIITDYTDFRYMPELQKVYTTGKADQDGDTLVLSGVLIKYRKGWKGESTAYGLPVSSNFYVWITVSGIRSPQFSVLYRLTDKKDGQVIFSRLISGPAWLVSEEFAKTLQETVDNLWKK